MLTELGRLVTATGNGALVLLVDQLEDLYNLDEAPTRFRSALDALRQVADHVPSSVIVVACLDEFYAEMRSALSRQMLDRLERDPDPVLLTANRSLSEIEALIAPRLAYLFERQHVQVHDDGHGAQTKPSFSSATRAASVITRAMAMNTSAPSMSA